MLSLESIWGLIRADCPYVEVCPGPFSPINLLLLILKNKKILNKNNKKCRKIFSLPKKFKYKLLFYNNYINKTLIRNKKGGLRVKKGIFIALMVISIFLVSACDVYNTLYTKQMEAQGNAVVVPEENISIEDLIENGIEDETAEEDATEEAEEVAVEETTGEVKEEPVEELSEDATVISVEETELVSLVPKAEDPDKDILTFTFTSPLNDNGEWQTNYGDAGEYTVTVTASDGESTTSKEVLIIVSKKEEAPVISSFEPKDTAVEIKETGTLPFNVVASDLNKDELAYSWKLDGVDVGDTGSFEYKTTYEDAGSHTVKVGISDGMFNTEKIWSVTIDNVNRKPVLKAIEDIKAKETDTVTVELDATDDDGDELKYSIDDDGFVQDGNALKWETAYDDSGEHEFTATVSDGTDSVSQQFKVTIENVNRAPVIVDIVQK